MPNSAVEDKFGLPDFMPTRLTVDLFKAARGVPTVTNVTLIRDGRRVRNAECEIVEDGVTVVRATMVAEAPASSRASVRKASVTSTAT